MTVAELRLLLYRERTELQKINIQANYQSQASTGSWLLTSLLALNGGALVTLISNADKVRGVLPHAGPWFISGILLAYVAGVMMWRGAPVHISRAQDSMEEMWSSLAKPKDAVFLPRPKYMILKLLIIGSVMTGCASLTAFVIGVREAINVVIPASSNAPVLPGVAPPSGPA